MSETPEMDRLKDRLFGDPNKRVKNFHVTWGPKAHLVSKEERVAQINKAMDEVTSKDLVDEDEDEAPQWTPEMFKRAEIRTNGEVVRPTSGTVTKEF